MTKASPTRDLGPAPSPVGALSALLETFAATGATSALTALMRGAIATGNPSVCEAVLAHAREHGPREGAALSAIDAELAADRRPPVLWCQADVAMPSRQIMPSSSDADTFIRDTMNALDVRWAFRRDEPVNVHGQRIVGRLLVPHRCANMAVVEAATRALARSWQSLVPDAAGAQADLLADALDRASKK